MAGFTGTDLTQLSVVATICNRSILEAEAE